MIALPNIRFRRRSSSNQRGFTLIELMVSVGIMSALGGVIATSSFAMLRAQTDTNANAQVAIEVSKSTRWFSRDVHRAASSDIVDLAPAVSTADFTWFEGGTMTTCNYSVNGGDNTLERSCNGLTTKVANGISALQFTRSGNLITTAYTVTSDLDPGQFENVELILLEGGG